MDDLHGTGPVRRGPDPDGLFRQWVYDKDRWRWVQIEADSKGKSSAQLLAEYEAREAAKNEIQMIENERIKKFQKYQRRAANGFVAMRKAHSHSTIQKWKEYGIEEKEIMKQRHEEEQMRLAQRHLPLIADVETRRLQLQKRREKDIETTKLLAAAEEKRRRREFEEEKLRADRIRNELIARAEEGKKRQADITQQNEERKKQREREKAELLNQQQGTVGAKIIGVSHDWLGPARNCTYLWKSGDGAIRSTAEPPPLHIKPRSKYTVYQPEGVPSFYSPQGSTDPTKPVEPDWAV